MYNEPNITQSEYMITTQINNCPTLSML